MKKKFVPIIFIICAILTGCNTVAEIDNIAAEKYAVDDKIIVQEDALDVYHLGDEAICGITAIRNDSIDFEAIAGFRATCDGKNVTITPYSHNNTYATGGTVYVSTTKYDKVAIGTIKHNETKTFDVGGAIDSHTMDKNTGIYRLSLGLVDQDATMFLYYDKKTIQTCRVGQKMERCIRKWNALVSDMNPDDYLDINYVGVKNNPITYPTSGQGNNCVHVDEWRQLSHTLLDKFANNGWSDEVKVYYMTYYLAENYAYDDWRVSTNHNVSRATLAQTWNDDSLWMYYNKVGNCWDCANVLTIMCREQGIPCTSVDNRGHTAVAVWLNDEWVCVDLSVLMRYHCVEKDTNPKKWIENREMKFRQAFGYYSDEFDTYNQGLCTFITATSYDYNP